MAKELPYFKFEPSEYLAKDIQDCSLEAQGAFINICSLYWLRLGELKHATALRRVCDGNANLLRELCEVDAIEENEGYISITFLDKQLEEFRLLSEKNSQNARKRWKKSGGNATVVRPHSDRNAIREEKRREEEKREEKKADLPWPTKKFEGIWAEWKNYKKEQFNFRYKSASTEQAALTELNKLASDENVAIEIINQSIANGWKGFFELKQNGGKQNGFVQEVGNHLATNDPDWKKY